MCSVFIKIPILTCFMLLEWKCHQLLRQRSLLLLLEFLVVDYIIILIPSASLQIHTQLIASFMNEFVLIPQLFESYVFAQLYGLTQLGKK